MSKRAHRRLRVIRGSGNIFLDLGFSKAEAESLKLRSELMMRIDDFYRQSGMTQAAAAKALGITQRRLNALLKGKIGLFSLDASSTSRREPGYDSWSKRRHDMAADSVIHSDPEILGGMPVFVGTRVPVHALIDYLEGGHSLEQFLDDFPSVSKELATAALELARQCLVAEAGRP